MRSPVHVLNGFQVHMRVRPAPLLSAGGGTLDVFLVVGLPSCLEAEGAECVFELDAHVDINDERRMFYKVLAPINQTIVAHTKGGKPLRREDARIWWFSDETMASGIRRCATYSMATPMVELKMHIKTLV